MKQTDEKNTQRIAFLNSSIFMNLPLRNTCEKRAAGVNKSLEKRAAGESSKKKKKSRKLKTIALFLVHATSLTLKLSW